MACRRSYEALEEKKSWTLKSRTAQTLGSGERKFSERESMGFRVKRRDSWIFIDRGSKRIAVLAQGGK